MLNRIAALLAATGVLALSACGQGSPAQSASSVRPADASVPSASSSPPAVPIGSLPELDPDTTAALKALDKPSFHGRGVDPGFKQPPISEYLSLRPCEEVSQWLEMPLPDLKSFTDAGYVRVCGTNWRDGALPSMDVPLPSGEPVEVRSYVLYVPPGVDLSVLTFAEAAAAKVAEFNIYFGPNIWSPAQIHRNPHNIVGGDTGLQVPGGPVVGVQNLGDQRTRIAWLRNKGRHKYNVTSMMPLDPVDAYRVILGNQSALR